MTHPSAPAAPPPNATPGGGSSTLGASLAWLADRAKLNAGARAAALKALPASLAPGATDPGPLVEALLLAGRAAEALRVVGCALPPREGVWWAWIAARHATDVVQQRADAARDQPPPAAEAPTADAPAADEEAPLPPSAAERAALAAAEQWIAQPTDDHRRAAWDAAQEAGLETPAGCAAAAAYFTGGSITPPNGPYVPPPAGIHVTMASTAVLLSATATDPARLREVAGAFAQQGVEVVRRLGGWDAAAALARQTFDAQAYQHAEASKPPKLPDQG